MKSDRLKQRVYCSIPQAIVHSLHEERSTVGGQCEHLIPLPDVTHILQKYLPFASHGHWRRCTATQDLLQMANSVTGSMQNDYDDCLKFPGPCTKKVDMSLRPSEPEAPNATT